MIKAILAFGLAVVLAISSSEEQCQSLLSVVDQEPSCQTLGNCTGLRCYNEEQQLTIVVVVDKCTDPIVINVTVTNATDGTVVLSQSFTETTVTGGIRVAMGRNASYVHVKVTTSDGGVQLLPYTEVPVNASVCQCEDLLYIRDVLSPGAIECHKNTECSGVDCTIPFNSENYSVETDIDPCTHPPGFFLVMRDPNNTVIYDRFFNKTDTITLPSGLPLTVTIEHRNYSMIIEESVIVNGQPYTVIPRKQIILDKSECTEPTVGPLPTGTPPPPVSQETCDAIKRFANLSDQCSPNDKCDGVLCHFLGYEASMQVLPCLHPPGIHVIIDDAFGERVYDEIIHNKTAIPLGELPGTYIVINVTEGDGSAIGLNVYAITGFSPQPVPLVPLTEIPYDRCNCADVSCNASTSGTVAMITGGTVTMTTGGTAAMTTGGIIIMTTGGTVAMTTSTGTRGSSATPKPAKSSNSITTIVVPTVLGVIIVVILVVVLVLCIVIFIMRKKRNAGFTFEPIPFSVEDDDVSVKS